MTESWDKHTRLSAVRSETLTQWQEHTEKMKEDFKSDVKPIPVTIPQSKSETFQGYRKKDDRETSNHQALDGKKPYNDAGYVKKDEPRERRRSRDRENRPKYDSERHQENRDERRSHSGRNEDADRNREKSDYRRKDHYRANDERKKEDDRSRDHYRRNDKYYSNREKSYSGSQDRSRNRDYGKDDEHSHKNTYKN